MRVTLLTSVVVILAVQIAAPIGAAPISPQANPNSTPIVHLVQYGGYYCHRYRECSGYGYYRHCHWACR